MNRFSQGSVSIIVGVGLARYDNSSKLLAYVSITLANQVQPET